MASHFSLAVHDFGWVSSMSQLHSLCYGEESTVIRAFLSGNMTNVHPQRSPLCPDSIKSTKLKVDGWSNIIMSFVVVQLYHSLFAGTCQPVVGSIVMNLDSRITRLGDEQ